jgi:hypothetical protein
MKPIILLVLVLSACAKPTNFSKPGATQEQFTADKVRCTYEAKLATANYRSSTPTYNSSQGAGVGVAEAIGQARAEAGLAVECMKAKGYIAQ